MTADPVRAHLHHLTMRGLAPASTIYARSRILSRLENHLRPVGLLDATPDDLAAWRATLTQQPGTVAMYISHVQCFYRWAVSTGLIDADPASAIPIPRTPRRVPRPISEAGLMKALELAPARLRLWLVLAAWCGLRACEIAKLRTENIRLHDTPPVLVITAEATKGSRERIIELSPFVLTELSRAELPVRGLAFTRLNGRPLLPCTVSRFANQHLHDCGIPDTLHSLRHRFGTQLYRHSHDLRLVQDLLGHQSPTTTAGYAAFDRQGAGPAVASLPVPTGLADVS